MYSLQPSPCSTQTLLINSLPVDESTNIAFLPTFAKTIHYASHKTIRCYTCNYASLITLQYVLHLPLGQDRIMMGKRAGNLYAFNYSSNAVSTLPTPHFLISLHSEGLFSTTNRIMCVLFNGVETLGEKKLNSLYPSEFFRASQIILGSPKWTDSLLFYSNVACWKPKCPLIFMASTTVFLRKKRGTC
jgi:hypothetical protein